MADTPQTEMVTLTIDGKEVSVPKGTNIIEAAKSLEIEVPFYCYHPHLSVPGNCRICQVEVEGAPKLMIGCHTQVAEGMVVRTHQTSEKVRETQASTMELLLINHPLDCTVCDQAGHCKLQDYHYEYNAKPSRFLEVKENKPKAVPLGSTVMLDAERCIACTRCVRFCDEVTETGEIGLLNRGDRYQIAVKEGRELDNPLSGTVVDLCPVGALTHRHWRFNTRIWYANPKDSICPGCSTGCNVKVYERDGQVVQVKARLNADVNKEWLCDEGRYGFERFLPASRVASAYVAGEPASLDGVLETVGELKKGKTLLLCAPDLTLEDYSVVDLFTKKCLADAQWVTAVRQRELTQLEQILISPDYGANLCGAAYISGVAASGFVESGAAAGLRDVLEEGYVAALKLLKSDYFDNVIFVGDRALDERDLGDIELLQALTRTPFTLGILSDKEGALFENSRVVIPGRSILEKSGMLINRDYRLQYAQQVVPLRDGTYQDWKALNLLAQGLGKKLVECESDRELTNIVLSTVDDLSGLSIRAIKQGGINLVSYASQLRQSAVVSENGNNTVTERESERA
jgi:NADH-quinone oxidoreductase subunit G